MQLSLLLHQAISNPSGKVLSYQTTNTLTDADSTGPGTEQFSSINDSHYYYSAL